ncbi:hypothetical protein K8I28_16360 [bacterium]|nr:hypothetical protein [bacterium]
MTTIELGKQYPKDRVVDKTGFLAKTRLHQSKFRADILRVECDNYGNYLKRKDAEAGLIFYDGFGIFQAVKERYPNYNKQLLANMLRSEHIPFNFFIPLRDQLNKSEVVEFFNQLLPNADIVGLIEFEIEFVWSIHRSKLLNDHTSFDAYVKYENSAAKVCGIGIEVKYTEKSYDYGKTEKKRMESKAEDSLYHLTTRNSGLYLDDAIPELRTKCLKQLWRNHLLGEKARQIDLISHFTYMHLYPDQNDYQKQACKVYQQQLTDIGKEKFAPITYEEFISLGKKTLNYDKQNISWLEYLDHRYIPGKE